MITVKQRQEFRVRLQKRARRKAEKRIDTMEEERHARIVSEINQLKHDLNRMFTHLKPLAFYIPNILYYTLASLDD